MYIMKKHILLFLVIIFGMILFGCSKKPIEDVPVDPTIEKEEEKETEPDIDPVVEEILPEEILIMNKIDEMMEGSSINLGISLLPITSTNREYEIIVSDDKVIKVENDALYALKSGTCKITIKAKANDLKVEFEIRVKEKPVTEIILKESETTIHVGDTYQIEYSLKNLEGKVEFYTKDLDFINLDKNGLVTAFEVGRAFVYLRLSGVEVKFTINIIEREKTSEELIEEVIRNIDIPQVTNEDIYLPTVVNGVMIDWTSGDRSILSDKGEVYYTPNITRVALYATFTHGDVDVDKTYPINIKPWSNEKILNNVLESINIDSVVTTNLSLATSYKYGVSAIWYSSRDDVISSSGVVSFKDYEVDVILKVIISLGEDSMQKEFSVKTLATKKMDLHYFVERAKDYNPKNMQNLELKDEKVVLKKDEVYGFYDSDIYLTKNFYELVGSWAAITNKTATVELLVRVKVGNNWSKYFTYGIWGLGKNNLYYNQNDTMAKMDTDEILVSTNNGCAFQYRIILRRNTANDDSPVLSLVAITMRMSDSNYTYDVDTSKLPDFVDYDVPKVNQNVVPEIGGVICSATTSTMLLKWKGEDFSKYDEYENRYIANLVADRGHNNPTYGNWVYNTAVIGAYGYDSYVRHMTSWEELKYHLATVGPIGASVKGNIGGVYTTGGHLLVVRGYKVVNGTTYVICNDPNINSRYGNDKNGNPLFVYYEFTLNDFMSFWRKTSYIIE